MWWCEHTPPPDAADLGRNNSSAAYGELTIDHRSLIDTVFEVQRRIIQLPTRHSRLCGLHGMNHLSHPGVYEFLKQFIAKNYEVLIDDDLLSTAEACRDADFV